MNSVDSLMNRIEELKAEIASREEFVDCIKREYPKSKLNSRHFIIRHQRYVMMDLKYTILGLEKALADLQKEMAKIKV
jgi:hypothetical protein